VQSVRAVIPEFEAVPRRPIAEARPERVSKDTSPSPSFLREQLFDLGTRSGPGNEGLLPKEL